MMPSQNRFFQTLASILLLAALLLGSGTAAIAQGSRPSQTSAASGPDPIVRPAERFDTSKPLLQLAAESAATEKLAPQTELALPARLLPLNRSDKPAVSTGDASLQPSAQPVSNMPTTQANFEGLNNIDGVYPPDTNGEIGYDPSTGNKYYVQWVNLHLQAWNVTNPAAPVALFASPIAGNALWAGFGGACETTNDGDPVVLFDHLANRWVMTQFSIQSPYYECIAISQTADPSGAYYRYAFLYGTTLFNDYPKLGVWPDGYYMMVHQFDPSDNWAGTGVVAYQRDRMLQGLSAMQIIINLGSVDMNFGGMMPADLDGPPPPAGTPNYFAMMSDSSEMPGDVSDNLRIWEFHVDWTTPANTTFGLNGQPNITLAMPNFDLLSTNCGSNRCIAQPGTTVRLDSLSDRLMFRMAYRYASGTASMVVNRTVDVDPAATYRAGIRWVELQKVGAASWTLRQNSTYSGDAANSDNRWMGSIAMDAVGNIALGYSVSSSTVYPSIRYTGRLVNDSLNTLPQGETQIMAGAGVQTGTGARWGDYSDLTVDPLDGCTFWYTQEYIQTTGTANWQTRIASFKFPTCSSGPMGTLSGTVTAANGGSPLANARLDIGVFTTVTNPSGQYTITLPVGTYSATASAYGYVPATVNNLAVSNGATTTQNFSLADAATITVSGTVKDGTPGGHTWPMYARIDIASYPNGPIYTNPQTGAYSVSLPIPAGSQVLFTVNSAELGGYQTASRTVTIAAGGNTENFDLLVDTTACQAAGYHSSVSFTPQGFEGSFPPPGWSTFQLGTPGTVWAQQSTAVHSGSFAAGHIYDGSHNIQDLLVTPRVAIPASGATLSFWEAEQWPTYFVHHGIWYTEDPLPSASSTYTELVSLPSITSWTNTMVSLNSLANKTVALAFDYQGLDADNWWIDDVTVLGSCSPTPGGLVTGAVSDANTAAPLNGAAVSNGTESTLSHTTAADPDRPDGFYLMFSSQTGAAVNLSAAKYGGYQTLNHTVAITANQVASANFALTAGRLTESSDTYTVTLNPGQTTTRTLTLNNTGSAPANFKLSEANGLYTPAAPATIDPTGRHISPPALWAVDAHKITAPQPQAPTLPGGVVSSSFSTGLVFPWGIGFNTTASPNDLWVGNLLAAGGDGYNHRYLSDGTPSADKIDTSPWAISWGADMTYNPYTGMLWQVNVGGDNCIYEMDPLAKVNTGNKICPAFATSERGLAYDPLTNTYFAGSWNDQRILRFDPSGQILSAKTVGLNISGLAYNPATGHLFVLTNSIGSQDVYVLDVKNDYAILGGFIIKDSLGVNMFFNNNQAGLEIGCDGSLWAVSMSDQRVYQFSSGETGPCSWMGIPWLSEAPETGAIANGASSDITLTFSAVGMSGGTYDGFLQPTSNTPYTVEPVKVRLIVNTNGVSVAPAAPAKSDKPGRLVTYQLQITNTGNASDSYNLTKNGNAWTTSLQSSTVGPLAPGQTANLEVSVQIPAGAALNAADQVTILATSQNESARTSSATITTSASTGYGVSLDRQSETKDGDPGATISYSLTVTNTGNVSDTFDVTINGSTWTTAPSKTAVGPLAAGASETITVQVTLPNSGTGGLSSVVTVTFTSRGDPGQSIASVLTTTLKKPFSTFLPAVGR